MPHVIVKMYPGRTDEQKKVLADKVVDALINSIGCSEDSISLAIEEVEKVKWGKQVYKPEILDKPEIIYKKPGYRPPDEEL